MHQEKFKKFSKEDKKIFRKLFKALHCPRDCEKCDKSINQCLLDIRLCLNIILRSRLVTVKKVKEKSFDSELMVS